MRKIIYLLVLYFFLPAKIFSQLATIKGVIKDTVEKTVMHNASVVLIRQRDSTMVGCTRAAIDGTFILTEVRQGKYLLMVTFPKYADYVSEIDISNTTEDVGQIDMTLKSQLLAEVVVTKKLGAIRIKGDTIEYKADSFYTSPGVTVEALLKKLPGIQVDRDGRITAQGESVKKILVDGEEFFSEDPTIVTRGLSAESVDRVQVYHKASEQEEMTGVKDGKGSKTIDLKLKESAKKGYFGKLEATGNGGERWNNNAMLNAFKGKRKLSVYGLMSSTKQEQPEMDMDMGEGMEANSGGSWGQGFPKTWTAAAQYANKWKDEKIHANAGYKYDRLNIASSGTAKSQYILPDTLYYINQQGNNYTSSNKHTASARYEWKVDSFASIAIKANGAIGYGDNYNNNVTQSLDKANHQVNSSTRATTAKTDRQKFNTEVMWQQKFRKSGRTLFLSLSQARDEARSLGLLQAENVFFQNEQESVRERIDQQKQYDDINASTLARFSYSEPVSRQAVLVFEYGLQHNRQHAVKTALEKDAGGKYSLRLDSLSNDFRFNTMNHAAGVHYRYGKSDRLNFSIGMKASQSGYTRADLKRDTITKYYFTNFYPEVSLNTRVGDGAHLLLSYNGITQNPSLEQVQPVPDNTDPLNIRIGNPNLKQAFTHNMSLLYYSYKLSSGTGLYANASFSTVENDFSEISSIDAFGRRVVQPVNVDGNYHARVGVDYFTKIKPAGIGWSINANLNKDRNISYVNEVKSINHNVSLALGFGANYDKENSYSLRMRMHTAYNAFQSSARTDVHTHYWSHSIAVDSKLYLPWKLELSSDCNVEIRQKTPVFNNSNNTFICNGALERRLFKQQAMRIGVKVYDILNQNKGISRDITSNFISERTNTSIRRYWMMSFTWNFKNQLSHEQVE